MMLNHEGLKFWFLTDESTRKIQQIKANQNVAIAIGLNLQIEGTAVIKSHPLDKENLNFINAFQEKHPDIYTRSLRQGRILQRKGTRVIEVSPTRILLNVWTPEYDKEDFEPFMYILHTESNKAYKVYGYTTKAYKE